MADIDFHLNFSPSHEEDFLLPFCIFRLLLGAAPFADSDRWQAYSERTANRDCASNSSLGFAEEE